MTPGVGMRADAAIVETPNQTPSVDAGMTDTMPDLPPEPPTCETADVIPADARGDIEYPVSNSSDVILLGLGHDTRRYELLQELRHGDGRSVWSPRYRF